MDRDEYWRVLGSTPRYCASFRLIKEPSWLASNDFGAPKKGDLLLWHHEGLVTRKGTHYDIGPSYLKFEGYRQIEQTTFGRLITVDGDWK